MRVNVSAVKAFQKNPRRWLYEYALERIPRSEKRVALDLGTITHLAFARHFQGDSIERALAVADVHYNDLRDATLRRAQFDQAEDLSSEWKDLRELLAHWKSRYEFSTLQVEQTLELPIPNSHHVLYGTPDRVVHYQGAYYHAQNRTLSGTTPIAPYLRAASLNLHELAYAWLLRESGMLPYGGTYFNIVRKLKLTGAKGKVLHSPEECFVQEFIPLDDATINAAIETIRLAADRMEAYAAMPPRDVCTEACVLGRFGNSLCPYFGVCTGEESLEDDSLYMDRPERITEDVIL